MGNKSFFCVSVILILTLVTGCNLKQRLPMVAEKASCYRFPTGDGPEDMVLDRFNGAPRILVSSYERRKPADHGEIYAFDIQTGGMQVLVRTNEPESLESFKPHGMDIRHDGGITELYVILHDPHNRGKRLENGVGIYRVYRNELRMTAFLEDPVCLWSPNDLSVAADGGIYLTNDYKSDLDLYFRRKRSEIAYYDPRTGKWKIVAAGLAFANGIYATSARVYVSTTLGNRILSYPINPDGSLGEPRTVTELKGGDNIMPYGKYILVCAHFDDFAFMRHAKDAKKLSPSVVFRIDPATGDKKAIFADAGKAISAASTALIYGKKLYISQVFDPFILVCDVPADIDW
ncbi:MAG: hypothetical protein GXP53_10835 [Deltaproteobacteria bacterium]|nr:hypothetical protein [Deltaproteobacteria bacterium]